MIWVPEFFCIYKDFINEQALGCYCQHLFRRSYTGFAPFF